MSDGWLSPEKDTHVAAKSPWLSNGEQDHSNETSSITRAGWGDNVAPGALNMPQVDNGLGGPDPNANGGNGRRAWRAGLTVAPDAGKMPTAFTPQNAQNFAPASSPDQSGAAPAQPGWRAGYPDSTYKGPGAVQPGNPNPSPWLSDNTTQNQQWRAGYPDSTYKGPDAPQAPAPSPGNGVPDWRTYIQQQQQIAQPGQPGPGGGMPGPASPRDGSAPGVPGNPGLRTVSDEQRQFIENSLHLRTSISGYLGTGAITGAAIGGIEWGLDKQLMKTIGQPHTGLMAWWETHSPLMKDQQVLTGRLTEIQATHAAKTAELAVAEQDLTTHARNLSTLAGTLKSKIEAMPVAPPELLNAAAPLDVSAGLASTVHLSASGPAAAAEVAPVAGAVGDTAALSSEALATEAARQALIKQHAFVTNISKAANPQELAKVLGTEAEVSSGAKLFAHDTTEAETLVNLAKSSRAKSEAELAVGTASKEMDRTQKMLAESVDEGAGTLKGRMFNGAAKGLAIAGASLAVGYGIDTLGSKIFGYKPPETDGLGRFALDGVAVPAILLSDMSPRWKFALAGSAFLSARVSDYFAGTGASASLSTLLRPNTADGVLITAAAMAPVDARTKAMLVGGAWVAGRVYNEVAHLTGLDGGEPAQLRDDSNNSFSHDQIVRTESSFDNAVEKGKALGKENEVALELQMRDWLARQATTAPLTFMRGTAVLADSLGQFRLESGSRFDLTSHADKKPRILEGKNFDFGGEATTFLRMSAGSLVTAQNYALSHKGQTIDGKVIDDDYIQQLKNEQTKVEAKLNLVYGQHDVQGVFNELVNQARVNSGDMQQALVRLKNQLDVLNSTDSRFVAKCNRDLAIGYLAEASYMSKNNNGEEARIMYQAAVQYLQNSQKLDAQCPDNQALNTIQSTVAQSIPGAIQNQYKSNLDNPFQLNTPNYGANLLGK